MLNSQPFVLSAARAGQHQRDFSGGLIKLRRKPQPVRAALEAPHREPAKRTVPGCLGRLIILPSLEIARRIHPRIVLLRPDKRCPTKGQKSCWKIGQIELLRRGIRHGTYAGLPREVTCPP